MTQRKAARVARANERRIARDARTPRQQIVMLDARLGDGVGAVRERARLVGAR